MRTAKAPAAKRGRGARRLDCRVTGAVGNARSRLIDKHTRGLAETEVAAPSEEVWPQLFDHCGRPIPRVRRVMSRICVLNLARALGAMPRSLPSFEMLNPRNLRSSGRATALFASLDLQPQLGRGKRIRPRICRQTIHPCNHSLSRSKLLKQQRFLSFQRIPDAPKL